MRARVIRYTSSGRSQPDRAASAPRSAGTPSPDLGSDLLPVRLSPPPLARLWSGSALMGFHFLPPTPLGVALFFPDGLGVPPVSKEPRNQLRWGRRVGIGRVGCTEPSASSPRPIPAAAVPGKRGGGAAPRHRGPRRGGRRSEAVSPAGSVSAQTAQPASRAAIVMETPESIKPGIQAGGSSRATEPPK